MGYPTPVVYWKKDGMAIDHSADRYQILASGSLLIRNVSLSDEGKYVAYISQMDLDGSPTEIINVFVQGLFNVIWICVANSLTNTSR